MDVEDAGSGSRPIEGVGTAVAAFVGFAARGPLDTPTLVTDWTQFTGTFGEFVDGSYLAHSVHAYLQNGGGNCYVVRINGNGAAEDTGDPRRSQPQVQARVPQAILGGYRVLAVHAGAAPGDITVEVTGPGGESPSEDVFRLVVRQHGEVKEEFDRATTGRGQQNVAAMVNAASDLVRIEKMRGATLERPGPGTVELVAPPPPLLPASPPSPPLSPDSFVGDVTEHTGFGGLETVDEITMLCVPDLMSAYQRGALDLGGVQAVQRAMIAHCERMGDRMAILDPPPGLDPQQVKQWRVHEANYDSAFAAMYWPWLQVMDPTTGTSMFMPPSGHMAGIWGRNDDTRGVHQAPANEVVRGALSLEVQVTGAEHDLLNPVGVNCLRAFPGRGIRVWGARTLSSDPTWRYLNVRRLANYLEESILAGTRWCVFEPNDAVLWARMRRTISAFLVDEWRAGALVGATPDDAFYVTCDGATNPAEAIDAGQVVCEIGVAPVKPAEFVVVRLAHSPATPRSSASDPNHEKDGRPWHPRSWTPPSATRSAWSSTTSPSPPSPRSPASRWSGTSSS